MYTAHFQETEEEIEEEIEEEVEDEDEDELVSAADDSLSNESTNEINHNTSNAFKSKSNSQNVDNSMHTKTNQSNNDNNDVICVLVNGQPTRFSANTIKLSQTANTEPLKHSHRVNEHELNKSSHNDKTVKVVSEKMSKDNGSCNVYEKSIESMQQKQQHPPKYSDDAMHLPDIVVGSTLLGSNGNIGAKKPIPLSRSPPKIVVNDNTLDSWTSNEDETGTISDSIDESLEIDDEVADLTDVSLYYILHYTSIA